MFDLSVNELIVVGLVCLPIVLLFGVMLKKMGYSDLTAIGLAVLVLTPANWLVLIFLIVAKWPIQEELDALRRQVADESTSDANPSPNNPNKASASAFHMAIRKGYADVVEALLAQGTDKDAKTPEGQTPLELAVACGRTEIAEILRSHTSKN